MRRILGLALCLCAIPVSAWPQSRAVRGEVAPDFRLAVLVDPERPAIGEESASLSRHRGEVVVVNFWASWCRPCQQEHGALSRVASMYPDQGVRFYGIIFNDAQRSVLRWLREMGGQPYPSLLDPGARTAFTYGVRGIPETYVIGRDGRVAFKHIGPVTEAKLIEHVELALTGGSQEIGTTIRPTDP